MSNPSSDLFVEWPSIDSFEVMRRAALKYSNITALIPDAGIDYRFKVKLHGVNVGIRINVDGTYHAQSRNKVLTPEDDLKGFAKFVGSLKLKPMKVDYIIFGEWFGKGIIDGNTAANKVDRSFAIFSLYFPQSGYLSVEPQDIKDAVGNEFMSCPNVYVLPWAEFTSILTGLQFDDETACLVFVNEVNKAVSNVEKYDPWIMATFGIEGPGEGLVGYPSDNYDQCSNEFFSRFAFKAKGAEHRVKASPVAATVNIVSPETVQQFVDQFVTTARLQQGISDFGGSVDSRGIGAFIGWMSADIQKESKAELEDSGLEWKAVSKAVTDKCRKWFIDYFAS